VNGRIAVAAGRFAVVTDMRVSFLLGVVTALSLLVSSARRARRRPWSGKSTTAELTFTQLGGREVLRGVANPGVAEKARTRGFATPVKAGCALIAS